MSKGPVIRIADIETFPNLAHVWGIWQQNVRMNMIMKEDQIAAFCYKDLGDDHTYYMDLRDGNEKTLVRCLRDMFDTADIIVGHNFKKFDDRWIIGRCLKYGLKPPSPYKIVDTLHEARRLMRIPSYRLEDVAKFLKVAEKSKHAKFPGHSLWVECMANNSEAWDEMEDYNRQDVLTNEEVYLKLRPYIKNHPNIGVYTDLNEAQCPKCGGTHIHWRGYTQTNTQRYQKFQCQDCGGWGRARTTSLTKEKRQRLITNA